MAETTDLPAPASSKEVKLEVLEATPRVSTATGTPYVSFKLRVVGTKHHLWDTLSLSPRAAWRVQQFAEGFLTKRRQQQLQDATGIDADTLGGLFVGRQAKALIKYDETYNRWMVREVARRA